ncbi:MAG: Gfo/Idh/MocA family oxidoreductase [Bacteroidota bacterium]
MKLDIIRWGIVGCGDVCEVKSGPAFQQIEHSELVAVMRRNGEKAKDFAQRHKVPKWYDDADEIIGDPEINAIYVATPPGSHMEYTLKALKQGKPVYVEKPMALNYAECREMVQASEEVNIPLFVAYYRRCLPFFLHVKDWIDREQIGKIRAVNIRLYKGVDSMDGQQGKDDWRVDPSISGGGHFVDLAAHQFDLLDFIFGPIAKVHGLAANQAGWYQAEDIVSTSFEFESGIVGSGLWCFSADKNYNLDEIEILGSKGRIVFPCFSQGPLHMKNSHGVHEKIISHPKHIQHPLIQTVVNELRGGSASPSSGTSAARTTWVMEKILESYYQ